MIRKSLVLAAGLAALGLPALSQPMPMPNSGKAPMGQHMKQHAGEDAAATPSARVAHPDVVVKVNGLVCDFCARALEKTFQRTGKVAGVSVDLTAKEVRLKFVKGSNLDDAVIRKLVKDAGYAVVAVNRVAA
jgi:copper chaperone CopZ